MLLGGMKVIGMYVWVGDNVFKNSTISLCQVIFFLNSDEGYSFLIRALKDDSLDPSLHIHPFLF